MRNKLLRLAELIQEDFSGDLVDAFKSSGNQPLEKRIALVSAARTEHQLRSERLWLAAGRKRTDAERKVAAQADLAAFVFAYLTGDGKEYAQSAMEALRVLKRQGEADLVTSLCKR